MERSTRTVFAYNLSLKADERDIFEFFSVAGRVLDVKLITDKNTKRSKGFAYIEYAQQTDVLSAVALTGQLFKGQAMMVKSSEHEKNLAWEAQQQAKQNQAAAAAVLGGAMGGAAVSGFGAVPSMPGPPLITGPCKLAVENLNPQVSITLCLYLRKPCNSAPLHEHKSRQGNHSSARGITLNLLHRVQILNSLTSFCPAL